MTAAEPQPDRPLLPKKLWDEANRLAVETAGRTEDEVRHAVQEAWVEENRAAINSWNERVDKNGLPLERYRLF